MNGENYLGKIQVMSRSMQNVVLLKGRKTFNDSEMRMIEEIVAADKKGEKLISTELADKIGVTRSAISQMVNRLSRKGLVKRVPDEIDRKIAYVCLDGKAKELYSAQRKRMGESVSKIMSEFSAEKLDELLRLADEFSNAVYRNVR